MKELDSKKNFLGLDKKNSSYKDSKVILMPVTFNNNLADKTISSILKESQRISKYDEEQKKEVAAEKGICSLNTFNITPNKKSFTKIERELTKHIEDEKFTVIIGSENIILLPSFLAYQIKYKDLSIVYFSAFSHLHKQSKTIKKYDDSIITILSNYNTDITQIGIRSISKDELSIKNERRIKIFYSREIKLGMYGDNWQEIAAKDLKGNVFIIFDISVFDPSIINSLHPEPGGLLWDETMNLLKIIGIDKTIVGTCITGFHPSKCGSNDSYFIAKLIYKILNYTFS